MKQKIVRQFTYENWAHIFMYAAIFSAKKDLDTSGVIFPLEVYIDGYVIGKIVDITIESDDKQLLKTTTDFIKNYKINEVDFRNAAEQVAIRNEWQAQIREGEIKTAILDINSAEAWVDNSQLELLCEDNSENDLVSPGINYEINISDPSVLGFRIFTTDYSPELGALAVLIIDILASYLFNQLDMRNLPIVSLATRWAEGIITADLDPVIAAAATFACSEDTKGKLPAMTPFFNELRKNLTKNQFEKKASAIITAAADDISKLFPVEELAWYSGVVMGAQGWKKLATPTNVKTILDKIQIESL